MSRIAKTFSDLKSSGRKGFIPFITAGDPDRGTSIQIARLLASLGADVIELGVPFSDPMADGPTIQRSSSRALAAGMNFTGVLEVASQLRAQSNVPIVLFSYYNPLMTFGVDRLREYSDVIDGVLITDVIEDEAWDISKYLAQNGIDLISLVAPTTTDARLEKIASNARGFIYAVSRTGVTGARLATAEQAKRLVERVRHFTDLPVAVGFGISTREQIIDVWGYADAAVVGSAIIDVIEKTNGSTNGVDRISEFVERLLPPFAKTGSEF